MKNHKLWRDYSLLSNEHRACLSTWHSQQRTCGDLSADLLIHPPTHLPSYNLQICLLGVGAQADLKDK